MIRAKFVNEAAVISRMHFMFDSYEREAYNIMKYYAIEAMKYFDYVQGSVPAEEKGMFWTNHTFQAAQGFFAKTYQVPGRMGITFGNTTWYAKKLEEGFDGRFASFPTLLLRFYPMVLHDLQQIGKGLK